MPALETLASGYGLVEGPCAGADGRLYFSDVTNGGVFALSPDGDVETLVPRRRGVGGIALHAEGGLVISGRDVCHVEGGRTRVLLPRPPGVGGFNDLCVDAQGRVLVGSLRSDPFSLGAEREPGECHRIGPGGQSEVLYGGIGLANGLGFSPDGATLYHADTAAGDVLAHDVARDGGVSRRRVFARCLAPDGLAVDAEGGVWVASYGGGRVLRFDAAGALEREVALPLPLVASCCFAGPGLDQLVVAAQDAALAPLGGGCLLRLRVDVPGLRLPLATI
jgi:gluconolactonase